QLARVDSGSRTTRPMPILAVFRGESGGYDFLSRRGTFRHLTRSPILSGLAGVFSSNFGYFRPLPGDYRGCSVVGLVLVGFCAIRGSTASRRVVAMSTTAAPIADHRFSGGLSKKQRGRACWFLPLRVNLAGTCVCVCFCHSLQLCTFSL